MKCNNNNNNNNTWSASRSDIEWLPFAVITVVCPFSKACLSAAIWSVLGTMQMDGSLETNEVWLVVDVDGVEGESSCDTGFIVSLTRSLALLRTILLTEIRLYCVDI